MTNKFYLKVHDAPWSYIGTKNVTIHSKNEELKEGDILKLRKGDRKSIATVAKIDHEGQNAIEIDHLLRESIDAKIGDKIEIEKIDSVPVAEKIIISVTSNRDLESPDEETDYSSLIRGKIVCAHTKESILEEGLTINILETSPGEIVRVSDSSIIIARDIDTSDDLKVEAGSEIIKKKPNLKLFSEIPDVTFADIGGLENVKKILTENIIYAIQKPELFKKIGYEPIQGILLFGPPGTGKTLIAKATAHESGANFIYMSASAFKDKWYGESERKMRETFEAAKNLQPCIIFIDEIDAIAEAREESRVNIVNQLLTLMDQISGNRIYVIAATNRLEMLDAALIRPGRLFQLEVSYPEIAEREKIFRIYLKDLDISDEEIRKLARETKKYSGAKIALLCNMAKLTALRQKDYSPDTKLSVEHIWSTMKILDTGDFMQFYGKDPNNLYDVV